MDEKNGVLETKKIGRREYLLEKCHLAIKASRTHYL